MEKQVLRKKFMYHWLDSFSLDCTLIKRSTCIKHKIPYVARWHLCTQKCENKFPVTCATTLCSKYIYYYIQIRVFKYSDILCLQFYSLGCCEKLPPSKIRYINILIIVIVTWLISSEFKFPFRWFVYINLFTTLEWQSKHE